VANALFIWNGSACFTGIDSNFAAHSHHALQISFALDPDPIKYRGVKNRWESARVLYLPPNRRHALRYETGVLASIYLDPQSVAAGHLLHGRGSEIGSIQSPGIAAVAERFRRLSRADASCEEMRDCLSFAIRQLAPESAARQAVIDPRVAEAIRYIHAAVRDAQPLTARGLGAAVDLSAGRITHLFPSQTGLPIRPYVLWVRMQYAMRILAEGRSLTYAAHEAGFSDQSHLSRAFRAMFGLRPSRIFGRSGRSRLRLRLCEDGP
jgi:AraC-like DNA-binding protein